MKKIIHWHENFYPIRGGGPAYIQNIILNIHNGYQHEVLTNYIEHYPRIEFFSVNSTIHRIPYGHYFSNSHFIKRSIISYPVRLINDLQSLYAKYNYLKVNNFDILHVHGISFYGAMLKLNYILKRNLYQKIINFSFVKQPKLLTLHNFFPGFTKDKVIIYAYNHYIDQFDNIICVDKHIYAYCIQYCREKSYNKNIWFIPNSIDIKRFFYAPPKKADKLKIGFAGRLAHTADLDMINLLISKLPETMEFHMAVTGDISLIQVPTPVKDRVKIFEDIPQSRMPEFYHGIDILFNPVLHKAVTRVTLESMACGRPVIMYKNSDRFPLISGKTGYLVNQNVYDITGVLDHVYRNPDKMIAYGVNAKEIVRKQFSNEVVIPKIKKLYEDLINE